MKHNALQPARRGEPAPRGPRLRASRPRWAWRALLSCLAAVLLVGPAAAKSARPEYCSGRRDRHIDYTAPQTVIFDNDTTYDSATFYGCYKATGRLTQFSDNQDFLGGALAGRFAVVLAASHIGGVPADAEAVETVHVYDLRSRKLLRYVHAEAVVAFANPHGVAAWLGDAGLVPTGQNAHLIVLDARGVRSVDDAATTEITRVAFHGNVLTWETGGQAHSAPVYP